MPDSLAFYLVAVINATSAIGRVGGGVLAVRYGAMNVMLLTTPFAALFTYVWPYMKSEASFIAVVALYGYARIQPGCALDEPLAHRLSFGPFVGLCPAPVAEMGDVRDTGLRVGTLATIMAVGA